jgi:hypothetical protein
LAPQVGPPRPGRVAAQAGLLEPAAASHEFMHPTRWAAARQQAAAAAGEDAASGASEASHHSFLLPGRTYSTSSESDLEDGDACLLPPGRPQAESAAPLPRDRPPQPGTVAGLAAPTLGMQQQQQQQQLRREQRRQRQRAAPPQPAAVGAVQPMVAAAPVRLPGAGPAVVAAAEPPLPLYGRGDHAANDAAPLTPAQRMALTIRAAQLLANFAPFLLLGSALLLLAAALDAWTAPRQRPVAATTTTTAVTTRTPVAARTVEESTVVVAPAGTASAVLGGGTAGDQAAGRSGTTERLRVAAFKLLLQACRRRRAAAPALAAALPRHSQAASVQLHTICLAAMSSACCPMAAAPGDRKGLTLWLCALQSKPS